MGILDLKNFHGRVQFCGCRRRRDLFCDERTPAGSPRVTMDLRQRPSAPVARAPRRPQPQCLERLMYQPPAMHHLQWQQQQQQQQQQQHAIMLQHCQMYEQRRQQILYQQQHLGGHRRGDAHVPPMLRQLPPQQPARAMNVTREVDKTQRSPLPPAESGTEAEEEAVVSELISPLPILFSLVDRPDRYSSFLVL